MGYFDYGIPQLPDYSEGVRYLGDALAVAAARRQQRQQHEEQMRFNREQEERKFRQAEMNNAYQNRIIDERAKREALKFNQDQQEHKQRSIEAARKAYADGNPQLAESILSGTVTYDPTTGAETGRGRMEMGSARDVGAPPIMPETQGFPDQQAMAALRMVPGMPQQPFEQVEQDRGEHDVSMRRFEADSQGYQERARQAENDRPVTFKFGGQDPGVTFTRGQQRYASRQAAADDFARSLSGVSMSDADRASAQQIYAGILSGGVDPAKAGAMFQKERLGVLDRGSREGIAAGHDATGIRRAEIMATRPAANISIQRLGLDERKERSKNLRSDLKVFFERHAAKNIQEDALQVPAVVSDLKSGNAQRQRNAMVTLWRMAQKDHRFSDQDARMSQTVDPSWLAQIENFVARGAEGQLADDVRDMAIATTQSFGKYLRGKQEQMKSISRETFIDSGQYDPTEADLLLRQQLPGWERATGTPGPKKRRRGPPEVDARNKAKAKSSSSLDEAFQ